MPRFADEEQPQASLVKDTLFGTSSIEGDPPTTMTIHEPLTNDGTFLLT